MSSFVLDQMAEMSLGSSPLYDQPSCGTYQYDHRGSSCELQNRYWKLGIAKKKDKRERMGFFSLSAREPGGTGAYRSKFVGALYVGYWAVDEYCPGSVPSPECPS